ncbi:amidohydrolase family protein [Hypoxylon argillaceum]|nr:amidohydrolase family protein [Hypoxylon argillaceum]
MGYIDVHHHFLPREYALAWKASGHVPRGLTPPPWTMKSDISFLDRHNIDAAILSLSAPGVSIAASQGEARQLARQINEEAATIRDSNPTRIGFFATLPLEDVAVAIEELCYAFDTLEADGVTLFTNYGGKYLGHQDFQPLWRELNQRGAVVFIHPISENGLGCPHTNALPPPIVDFPHETTKTAVNLITSDTVKNNPNCKIILSHGGGTLPFVATRVANLAADIGLVAKTADEFMEEAKSFYFDLALTCYEDPVTLLTSFARENHLLWGSDFPFAREMTIENQILCLESLTTAPETRESIMKGAAVRLFPRFGKGIS